MWAVSDRWYGGLSFSSEDIGNVLAVAGIIKVTIISFSNLLFLTYEHKNYLTYIIFCPIQIFNFSVAMLTSCKMCESDTILILIAILLTTNVAQFRFVEQLSKLVRPVI